MSNIDVRGKRGAAVLRLLCKYGPLSVRTLEEVMRPPIKRKRMMEVAVRLKKRGLIFPIDASDSGRGSTVFEVTRSLERLESVAKILGRETGPDLVSFIRGREIKHGEQCARWAEFFGREFPDSIIVRDWEICRDAELRQRIVTGIDNGDTLPDFVVKFKREHGLQPVLIGVEVERTQKKFGRLLHKMRGLVMQTQLDGVVFLCGHSGIGDSVRRAMRESGVSKSRRIGRYFRNYLVFASFMDTLQDGEVHVANLGLEVMPLRSWVNTLRTVPDHKRDETCFLVTG
jgi:hypothetical protein